MSELQLLKDKPVILLAVMLAALGLIIFLVYQVMIHQYAPVNPHDKKNIDIIIPENSSARQVAALLKGNNLIHNESAFKSYCNSKKMAGELKAGHYRFSRSQSLPQIAGLIAAGKTVGIILTVPEGYSLEQIGDLLVKRKIVTDQDWQEAIKKQYNYDFLPAVLKGQRYRLEGFLFPDTYIIEDKTNATGIIRMMLNNFQKVWNSDFAQMARQKNISIYKSVTIASLIEKEAKISTERPIISGVISNRLNKGMLLQMCPTVLYSLDQQKDKLTLKDLEVKSPYNTYKNPGLPPGPIASPGRDSIKAALNPQANPYYYYVAKGDGSHYFSKTFAEHLAAQKKYDK